MAMMRDGWSRNPFHNTLRWLWVPAFAGTTVGRACLSGWPMSPDCRIALLSAVPGRWRVIRRETWANERFHAWQRRSRLRRERGPVGEVFCHRLVMGIS
jgi:hypothetical protein